MNHSFNNEESFAEKTLQKLKDSIPAIAGMLLGGIGGYFYYSKVGCTSGSCPITSNPWLSILWGIVTGYLIGSMFTKKPKQKNK